jgi:hypothetical protein
MRPAGGLGVDAEAILDFPINMLLSCLIDLMMFIDRIYRIMVPVMQETLLEV